MHIGTGRRKEMEFQGQDMAKQEIHPQILAI